MRSSWNRRELIKTACAGIVLGLRPVRGPSKKGAQTPLPMKADELLQLAERIAGADRARAFDVVEPLLARGLSWPGFFLPRDRASRRPDYAAPEAVRVPWRVEFTSINIHRILSFRIGVLCQWIIFLPCRTE